MFCSICGATLEGKEDTFGCYHFPVCWTCYSDNAVGTLEMYGLGPHHHDLTKTGSFIGSTVMEPLPEPNEEGCYIMADGAEFIPDPDCEGLGVWIFPKPTGWR